jgi:hypothetical protein
MIFFTKPRITKVKHIPPGASRDTAEEKLPMIVATRQMPRNRYDGEAMAIFSGSHFSGDQ